MSGRRLLASVGLVVALLPGLAVAQTPDTVFLGSGTSGQLLAVSVPVATSATACDAIAARLGSKGTFLIYQDYRNLSRSGPLAMYEQGKRVALANPVGRLTSGQTIGQTMGLATTQGGRTGATCRDGSHSGATGSGACSHHGGVAQWITAKAADPNAVVATICSDYTLKAGSGGCSVGTKTLVLVQNHPY